MSPFASLPSVLDFFPPTPAAHGIISAVFQSFVLLSLFQWTPLSQYQAMGRTSFSSSRFNTSGRYAWVVAEAVGPLNLVFILFRLPQKIKPSPSSPTSFIGTGLPAQNEVLGLLYILHYINRAIVCPLILAPSMSPIHIVVGTIMAIFQFLNSSNIASWLVYSAVAGKPAPMLSVSAALGFGVFLTGLAGNIAAENSLFAQRRGAAKRKARSEGKAIISYEKVYVIPPALGLFKQVMYPHYALEWLEWTGYAMLGWAFGLGWNTPALWFVIVEIATMYPRAVDGKRWYERKFGKRALAGRGSVVPASWL